MNKIIHRLQFFIVCVFLFVFPFYSQAQDSVLNRYGLRVISKKSEFNKTVAANADKAMIDIKKKIPNIVLELRYAGANNFMKQKLYPSLFTTYLRKPAADSLAVIQTALNKTGLGLKIFDAYRPYAVTEKMWELVKDDRYAADPKNGSGHNRGTSVDVTLVYLNTGKALDMGTGFDNFTDTAHHTFINLPEAILQNRLLLKNIMEKHGFKALDTEWWHYSFYRAKEFELLDVKFSDLQTSIKKRK